MNTVTDWALRQLMEQSNPKVYVDRLYVDMFMKARRIGSYGMIADLIGVHNVTLHRVINGDSVPSPQNLARMCAVLGCQPGDILRMKYNLKGHSDSEHNHEEVEHEKIESRPTDAPIEGTVPKGQD